MGFGGGDETAGLRHQGDQGGLADVGGFAGHIGAGKHQHPGLAGKLYIVWHVAAGGQHSLHYRVPAFADADFGAVVYHRAHVVVVDRGLGQSAEHVGLGDGGGGAGHGGGGFRYLSADPAVDFRLGFGEALAGG